MGTKLPNNVWLWVLRLDVIDPSTGARILDGAPIEDWLSDRGGTHETKPEEWYLHECEEQLRRENATAREYIVRVRPVMREYEYVMRGGLLTTRWVGQKVLNV